MTTTDFYTENMNEAQRASFYAEYQQLRKDELIGILLAIFLGSFGAHHFYLGRKGLGILYLCFFWCGLPGLIALIECFFIPGRVREYNTLLALHLQETISRSNLVEAVASPYAVRSCPSCGFTADREALFCTRCGAKMI